MTGPGWRHTCATAITSGQLSDFASRYGSGAVLGCRIDRGKSSFWVLGCFCLARMRDVFSISAARSGSFSLDHHPFVYTDLIIYTEMSSYHTSQTSIESEPRSFDTALWVLGSRCCESWGTRLSLGLEQVFGSLQFPIRI